MWQAYFIIRTVGSSLYSAWDMQIFLKCFWCFEQHNESHFAPKTFAVLFFFWHEPLSQAKSKVHLIKYMSIQLKCTLTQNVHLSAYCCWAGQIKLISLKRGLRIWKIIRLQLNLTYAKWLDRLIEWYSYKVSIFYNWVANQLKEDRSIKIASTSIFRSNRSLSLTSSCNWCTTNFITIIHFYLSSFFSCFHPFV